MAVSNGLKNSLNRIRELSTEIYHQYIPVIEDDTDISVFATPILDVPVVQNEFMNALVQRIVYTQIDAMRTFKNPLAELEGDNIPLGYIGQELHINPAKARQFNVNDFAGLLQKYEADVKVQYLPLNMDLQYPVTVSRHKLKEAFTSWESLDNFINGISQSLYNGARIGEYNYTKELVASAYKGNKAVIQTVSGVSTEAQAKAFIEQARRLYLDFQAPSSKYNAYKKVGGSGKPVTTWTDADNIVVLIKNEVLAYVDVNVLADAFNMSKTDFLGRVIPVDNFDIYSDDGELVFDGSAVIGGIFDKNWFKIKKQDEYLDEFYNANNRTWNLYLNLTKMYQYSLFANGVIFATEQPEVAITGLSFNTASITIDEVGDVEGLDIITTPATANTPAITFSSGDEDVFTVEKDGDKHCKVTATGEGTATLTATAGSVTTSISVVIPTTV